MPFSIEAYLVFVSVVTLIVVTPGPNLFLLLGQFAGSRRRAGFAAVAGIAAAIVSHAALALAGVGAIVATSATLFLMLKAAGAVYLMWLGIRSLWSLRDANGLVAAGRTRADEPSLPLAFRRGYLTNILSPKPAIFYVAAFPQFVTPGGSHVLLAGAVFALTHALIAIAFYGAVILAMARLGKVLERRSVVRTIKSLSGTALILFGGRLLLARTPS